MASQSSVLLSGNGNHDAKYAGLTHGSQRMLPALVSIRKPACPTLVIRTDAPPARFVRPAEINGSYGRLVFRTASGDGGRDGQLTRPAPWPGQDQTISSNPRRSNRRRN